MIFFHFQGIVLSIIDMVVVMHLSLFFVEMLHQLFGYESVSFVDI
jgi:hypothetical protein